MLLIRIGPRTLAGLGMALALLVGIAAGSLRPVSLVAADRMAPPASALPAPVAQASPRISLEMAERMLQGAIAYAREHDYPSSFVVLDAGGHLLASARMDGAALYTIEFARGKAYGSAVSGRSSAALGDSYQNNPALWGGAVSLGYQGPLLPSRGALPVMVDGVLVGAMGGSGGPSQEDENAVAAGLAAAGLQ
ncbi:MAG TPA: heme-binding protein [Chloroflexota bacterium]|nr:heme-binding protein [Chloroflexota bacterium]